MAAGSLDTAAHVVQLALTPVFLLTAVGSLLNVFSSRLARVVDRIHVLKRQADGSDAELGRLRLRSQFLDAAVLAAAVAGGLTCCAAGTIFFGVLRDTATASVLFGLFGLALVAATAALFCFASEIFRSGRAVRAKADAESRRALRPHTKLAISMTFLQVGIALASISALTHRRWLLGVPPFPVRWGSG